MILGVCRKDVKVTDGGCKGQWWTLAGAMHSGALWITVRKCPITNAHVPDRQQVWVASQEIKSDPPRVLRRLQCENGASAKPGALQ